MGSTFPKPPNIVAEKASLGPPFLRDYILRPMFALAFIVSDFTIVRLWLVVWTLPLYLLVAFSRSVLPHGLGQLHLLFSAGGREKLRSRGWTSKKDRAMRRQLQFEGRFEFKKEMVERIQDHPALHDRVRKMWAFKTENLTVCNINACVTHETPTPTPDNMEPTKVVLLHGNPSWSFMYRNIIPTLVSHGYEVFALDWIGFGLSDKPLAEEEITFELQMHALIRLFGHYTLKEAYVLAHDWGGCIALCTVPLLPPRSCAGIFLLNSFFPPRLDDISLNCQLLYALWLSSQGLLDGLLPESLVMRYMAPAMVAGDVQGYSAPFRSIHSKTAISRFAKLVPGMPNFIYTLFSGKVGLLLDGLCPITSFSSLDEQVALRKRDTLVRQFWNSGKADIEAMITFGRNDPLLRDYYDILTREINTKSGKPGALRLKGAGHYPTEGKSDEVGRLFVRFVDETKKFASAQ